MNTKLEVEIEPPEDGWTTIKLAAGENEYSFFPSDVPCDSIHELIITLLSLVNGSNRILSVSWNDEPVEHEFIFNAQNGDVDYTVLLFNDSNDVGFKRQREKVFSYAGSINEVVHPFWKALREMQSKQSHEEYEKHWSNPFPRSEMLELTQKLKELKLKQN